MEDLILLKKRILIEKIIVICRGIYGTDLVNLVSNLQSGGLNVFEVTFDQSDRSCELLTANAVNDIKSKFNNVIVGTGTVLSKNQTQISKDCGSHFVVSPHTDKQIISYTKRLDLISIPGAMTPTEILSAHKFGADIIKIFPAAFLGTRFIKDIRAPLGHIDFLAAAGINERNISEFLKAGYGCFGISERLTDKLLIKKGQFDVLVSRAKEFLRQTNR